VRLLELSSILAATRHFRLVEGDKSMLMKPGVLTTLRFCSPKSVSVSESGFYASRGSSDVRFTLQNRFMSICDKRKPNGLRKIRQRPVLHDGTHNKLQ
jgi:hypothetical protein